MENKNEILENIKKSNIVKLRNVINGFLDDIISGTTKYMYSKKNSECMIISKKNLTLTFNRGGYLTEISLDDSNIGSSYVGLLNDIFNNKYNDLIKIIVNEEIARKLNSDIVAEKNMADILDTLS